MFDIYAAITDRIIEQMEQGIIPWHKGWTGRSSGAISHTTGKPYSFLNQMLLGGKAGEYLTFKECEKEGGKVRKGEKASMVVFWKWVEKKDESGAPVIGDNGKPEQIPFLRYFNVFHIDQCEGIKPRFAAEQTAQTFTPDETAERIIVDYVSAQGITLSHQAGDRAFYQPSTDSVVLPLKEQFTEMAEYYSTAFHELTHSTGHASRLNRLSAPAFYGSENYSKEELVAEIGASALVHHTGLETPASFKNNVAYIQNWLSALRDDKKFIVSAAGKAEKAVAFILSGKA
ncbi:MAG: zincin-like metallopeptidase domain-containing protein [Clostridia bacterium]|nr:zincin-like metallopeptidase domain-containing protein [Clostridia bacterium]